MRRALQTILFPPEARGRAAIALAAALLATGCGHAGTEANPANANNPAAALPAASTAPAAADKTLSTCAPADEGSLRARLQGAIDADIDWSSPTTAQCLGGPRPSGGGVRLVYKGSAAGAPLLIVVGIALPPQTLSARNVPANLTIVREGAGLFYATQGDDKCAFDDVRLEPLAGHDGRYRLRGRGYCTQPARALRTGEGSVFTSRFDADALVDLPAE